MSKKKLFDDDSDEDITLKTENEYAKKYDTWRGKEEIHKLEQKYGPDALNAEGSASSDSEDESDEPLEVSEETEAQFLKTLALLKTKDPRIYDPNFKCFQEDEQKEEVRETKSKTLTFEDSDDEDDQDGDIFKIEKKAEIDDVEEEADKRDGTKIKKKKEGKIKEYLTGQTEHIDDEVEKDLAPLKALWSDPKLNEGEAFLRDYILNKKYLEEGEVGEAGGHVRDDDELEVDEVTVEEQAKFERAYNFRFEEPDEEYLKRFPRTMNYIRPKDERRARKRAEVRTRKEEEKKRKMEEIARLKALKLREIRDKIARIKEVTGNQDLAFQEEDIEGDFDPSEHDRRMRALFDEQFYGEADETKPIFPDLDEELEIENWDKYEVENEDGDLSQNDDGPHCEDDNFNMDADYDPRKSRQGLLEQIQKTLGTKRRNRKRQSKLSQILATEKPKFLPLASDRTYAEHMDEYYKLDCEDIVGGMPTRFKYREVLPNDYGLTIEEILLADDKELTQWVPLKKIVKYRPDAAERGDLTTYRQRAADDRIKRKLLPSLYRELPQEPEIAVPVEQTKKKKKKKNKNKNVDETKLNDDKVPADEVDTQNNVNSDKDEIAANRKEEDTTNKKNKKSKHELKLLNTSDVSTGNANNEVVKDTNAIKIKKSKRKRKLEHDDITDGIQPNVVTKDEIHSKNKKAKNKLTPEDSFNMSSVTLVSEENTKTVKRKKSKLKNKLNNPDASELTNKETKKEDEDNEITENSVVQTNKKTSKNKQKLKGNKTPNENTARKENKSGKIVKKNKFKNKNKFKSKHTTNTSNDNPLGKLSDERLKAYGLNPKKYRGFLKYKKF